MHARALALSFTALVAGCHGAASPPLPASSSIRLPTAAELVSASSPTMVVANEFLVGTDVAERWAIGFARESYHQPRAAVCLRLPRRDVAGAPISFQMVLSPRTGCSSFEELLGAARDAWPAATATTPTMSDLASALQTSGKEFVTVEVSAFSFRHPLVEAFRGLPPWLLRLGHSWPDQLPRACSPAGLLLDDPARGQIDVATYDCGGSRLHFNHHLGQLLAAEQALARQDANGNLRRLQSVLRTRYRERPERRVDEMNRLWTRFLDHANKEVGR